MAKKQEDSRDIFDKALDEASGIGAVSGAVLGAVAGARASVGRRAMKAFKKVERGEKLSAAEIAILNKADRRMLPAMFAGGAPGMVAGGYAGEKISGSVSKRRK